MIIEAEWFKEVFPAAQDVDEWVDALNLHLEDYGINTPERVSAFLSQCGVETVMWTKFEENMNYSASRMMQVWPKIFDQNLANKCHRKPELVANYAYANRMGNGPPDSGDGWLYRGRGPIHLTGKKNYIAFAQDTFEASWEDVVNDPDLVCNDKSVALASALWFWDINALNRFADDQDIKRLTRAVNGGYNGLDARLKLYGEILSTFE